MGMMACVRRDTLLGPGSLMCFPNIGTQTLLWCTDSTAPACGIIPQCPDSTDVATPGEDAVPEAGSRTGISGAKSSGRGGVQVEGSAAQVMVCRDTQHPEHQAVRKPLDKVGADTPPGGWQTLQQMESQGLPL